MFYLTGTVTKTDELNDQKVFSIQTDTFSFRLLPSNEASDLNLNIAHQLKKEHVIVKGILCSPSRPFGEIPYISVEKVFLDPNYLDGKYIVIELDENAPPFFGGQIVHEKELYLNIYSKVFGPASRDECQIYKQSKHSLADIQESTAKLLGVSIDKVSYITEELVEHYRYNAIQVEETEGDTDLKISIKGAVGILDNWGTHGNSITYDKRSGGKIYWKQDPKGTANYGCGTSESWSAGKQWASHIAQKGSCGGFNWFFIGNYNG